jgi:type II secretory pathway pseudopilin PulG
MMGRREAFSRIELFVLVLILSLVAGLIIPAILKVRESAAQSRCQNNLKQLALAFHNHNDATGRLPCLTDFGDDAPTGNGVISIFGALIPYIEQGPWGFDLKGPLTEYNGHSSMTFTLPVKSGVTRTITGGQVNRAWKVFIDPSDTTAAGLIDIAMKLPDGSTGYYATGSYVANGLVFINNDAQIPKTFGDGTSLTLMLAERPQVCQSATGENVYNLWGLGFYSPHMPSFATLTPGDAASLQSTGQIAPVEPLPHHEVSGMMPVRIGTSDAQAQASPVSRLFQTRLVRGGVCDPRLPGSTHRDGMVIALADGTVRLLPPTISDWIFWAMCTPNGNEVGPWFFEGR